MQMKAEVVVVIGAGGIGIAIARRQGFGKHILLADFNETLLETAAKELELASYQVSSRKIFACRPRASPGASAAHVSTLDRPDPWHD